MNYRLKNQAVDAPDKGTLQVDVTSALNNFPISGATVAISYTGEPDSTIEQVTTDSSGQTENLELATPPLEYSLQPSETMPYAEYTLQVSAPGFETQVVSGTEVLPGVIAIQPVRLIPLEDRENPQPIVIPDHTLYGIYPAKMPEAEIKPVGETGEIVLSRVVVPETVIVHDGVPTDTTAQNYYVPYRDYIKNVASSEIYATWPESSITANVLAIMSFTLNRVYTEWYRNKGYDFTITSSTAFDHKWIFGRNVFSEISVIVDDVFANYLSRPDVKQPILTQYCDGRRVQCPNWMSQWGSSDLGARATVRLRSCAIIMAMICISTRRSRLPAFLPPGRDTIWISGLPETKCASCRSSSIPSPAYIRRYRLWWWTASTVRIRRMLSASFRMCSACRRPG